MEKNIGIRHALHKIPLAIYTREDVDPHREGILHTPFKNKQAEMYSKNSIATLRSNGISPLSSSLLASMFCSAFGSIS